MKLDIKLILLMLVFGGLMMIAGWQISKPYEYHEGVKDGKNATMLIDMSKYDKCEITYEIRRVKEFK